MKRSLGVAPEQGESSTRAAARSWVYYDAGTPTTSALPPTYDRARRRLNSLSEVPEGARHHAWKWLLAWRGLVQARARKQLPAPYIFANDSLQIELEWETRKGELMLRLVPDAPFEYLVVEKTPAGERTIEGQANIAEICSLIVLILE